MTQKTRIDPSPPEGANWLVRAMYRVATRRFGKPHPEPVVQHECHPLIRRKAFCRDHRRPQRVGAVGEVPVSR